jgi:hypothetical protein
MSMFTLLSFAAHLGAIEADLKLAGTGILAEYALAVRQNAMDTIWHLPIFVGSVKPRCN